MDESELVTVAREGSPDAFAELLRLHQGSVRSYLARFVRSWDVVDDLAQETFLAAYRSLDTYKGESPLRQWLLGVARNRALMHLREEELRRARESGPLESLLAGFMARRLASKASEGEDHDRRLSALDDCLKGLPETSAELFTARYVRRHTSREIARQSGRKEGAIRMTLFRIRHALRECIRLRVSRMGVTP